MSEFVIEAQALTKQFGNFTAVDSLDLHIPKACIYGFLGPNGCGKSTTIRMLTGLLIPSKGSVNVLGLSLPQGAEALRLQIGYMTQKFSLYNDLTIEENLQFVAKIFNFNHKQEKARIEELLHTYGLDKIRKQLSAGLSGGQKQRLALAASIFHRPKLLFLDEPTSAVDPENRRDFWEILFDLCDGGTTILVSTHYMDEAERCHALAILEAGKLRADGAPLQLMQQMRSNIVEIDGPNLRDIKLKLIALDVVHSVAQQGVRLRIIIDESIQAPESWIANQLAEENGMRTIETVHPSLEDVFVHFTQEGRQ